MEYTIKINEAQRTLLHIVLNALAKSGEADDDDLEMLGMIAALPADEQEDPGCVHDFTV